MKRILITGGNGFIAKHIILQLLQKDIKLNVTLRNANDSKFLLNTLQNNGIKSPDINFFEADLEHDEGWKESLQDCSAVIHTACPVPEFKFRDRLALEDPIYNGTMRLLKLAHENNLEKIIFTSSLNALAFTKDRTNSCVLNEESNSFLGTEDIDAYTYAKTKTSLDIWQYAKDNNIKDKVVVIYPGLVFGPCLDQRLCTSTKFISQMIHGEFPIIPSISWPVVDVRDVAAIHIKALDKKILSGQKVIVAGESISLEEIGQTIKEKAPRYQSNLPKWVMPDFIAKFLLVSGMRSHSMTHNVGMHLQVNNQISQTLLSNYKLRSPQEAIEATLDSFIRYKIAA